MPISRQLLRPVSSSFILSTFILSLSVNLLPWQAGLVGFAPDFVALFIIYWTLNQPRRVGVGLAFFLGLLMDVADGNILGQHALAYTVIAYLTLARQRQLAVFPFWQQAFVALGLMLAGQALMLLLRTAMGAPFPGWAYFAGSFVAAFIWPPLSNILLSHQRRPTTDEL
ncbi:rod shape-determining protein MreD [Iodobacter arcticus]|uniref:Rod shape-determining protein MreD n=1 Tax=Iodobacter arcticus TaxID=590593 RepID=A0ABW2QSH4_9NEIS